MVWLSVCLVALRADIAQFSAYRYSSCCVFFLRLSRGVSGAFWGRPGSIAWDLNTCASWPCGRIMRSCSVHRAILCYVLFLASVTGRRGGVLGAARQYCVGWLCVCLVAFRAVNAQVFHPSCQVVSFAVSSVCHGTSRERPGSGQAALHGTCVRVPFGPSGG
jgi:hypothetical protein